MEKMNMSERRILIMSENRKMRIYLNDKGMGEAVKAFHEKMDCVLVRGAFYRDSEFTRAEQFMMAARNIELCDGIYMARGWEEDSIQVAELSYAKALGKRVYFESRQYNVLKQIGERGAE